MPPVATEQLLRRAIDLDERLRAHGGPGEAADARLVAIELCDAYRRADTADRLALRAGVRPLRHVLYEVHAVLDEAASRVADERDPDWLVRGLAAAALTDGGLTDYRDRRLALQDLWRASGKAALAAEADQVWSLCRAPDVEYETEP